MKPITHDICTEPKPRLAVVVIGRNEGQRLVRCLKSVAACESAGSLMETLYVDSDSSDGSAQRAAALGARVIELRSPRPSAAQGRNAGWRATEADFVLFLDGDTQLHPAFIRRALAAMADPEVAVVWGHRREAHPEQSLYVRALDLDWIYPPGFTEFCGGDALMRRAVLEQLGGFDASLIAGEEPELCRRIRAAGGKILHIDAPMTLHDLGITRFSAYWKHALRAGHAYAEVASRWRHSADPLWQKDARRNLIHGAALLAALPALLLACALWPGLAAGVTLGGTAVLLRSAYRCGWKTRHPGTRLLYALHSHFQQVPILLGQIRYHLAARRGRRLGLIDYKGLNNHQTT